MSEYCKNCESTTRQCAEQVTTLRAELADARAALKVMADARATEERRADQARADLYSMTTRCASLEAEGDAMATEWKTFYKNEGGSCGIGPEGCRVNGSCPLSRFRPGNTCDTACSDHPDFDNTQIRWPSGVVGDGAPEFRRVVPADKCVPGKPVAAERAGIRGEVFSGYGSTVVHNNSGGGYEVSDETKEFLKNGSLTDECSTYATNCCGAVYPTVVAVAINAGEMDCPHSQCPTNNPLRCRWNGCSGLVYNRHPNGLTCIKCGNTQTDPQNRTNQSDFWGRR